MKKAILLTIIILILVVGGFFLFRTLSEVKPFSDLSAGEISEVTFSVNYYGTIRALDEHEIDELVSILRKVATYSQDNSHANYNGGQNLTFNITKTDGSEVSIMGHASTIVIDGAGYRTKSKSLEELRRFGNSLGEE